MLAYTSGRSCALAALALGLALARVGPAQTAAELDSIKIAHKKFVLDNGLTLLVHEDHSVPAVSVNLWYHVGSRNEQRGKTGFAHLFEHFFFNGSQNYPHGFREAMDDLGANNRNGTTNFDRTNFFEDVPTSALERTLYLEADRMGFLAAQITAASLEREKGVVKNEKNLGENQPYGRSFTRVLGAMYPYSHPYSWSVIGRTEDLDAASLEDVRQWYRSFYGPNNCVLSLAGDVTPERALALAKKYFGSIPPSPPLERYRTWIPRLDRDIRDQMEDRVPQTRIYRAYHAPAWSDPEGVHLSLVAHALSGTKSSRLTRRLVYEKKLATAASAIYQPSEISGMFILVVTVRQGADPAEAEREMDAVMSGILTQGPTGEELERARASRIANFARSLERTGGFGGRSDVLAMSMIYGGKPDAYLDQFRTAASTTPAAVKQTAEKWLKAHHYTLAVDPFGTPKPESSSVDRSVLPALQAPSDVAFPKVQTSTLKNGLKIMLIERHTAPLVEIAVVSRAGYAADPAGKTGLSSLALNVMQEGTATRDGFKLTEELEALGATLTTRGALDISSLKLQVVKTKVGPALDLFSDVVLHPAFAPEMVDIAKRGHLARIEQEKATPLPMALRIVPKLLYSQSHAYAAPLTGSGYSNTVSAITRDDLAAWHQQWFKPNNSVLIATGDIEMAQLVQHVNRVFGDWQRGDVPAIQIGTVPGPDRTRVYLIDKPGATQSVIVAAHLAHPAGQPDELAIETVMHLFGGMSTSRLNRNLRLDKHWSYGVFGMLMEGLGQRPFMVVAPVQTDKTRESMLEVTREIEGIAGKSPVQGDEFQNIKRTMTLGLAGRFATLASLGNAALNIATYGYPEEYYYGFGKNAEQLTEKTLAAAASRYVQPGKLTWVVVGDLARIEKGVRELNYGEVIRLDPEGNPLP